MSYQVAIPSYLRPQMLADRTLPFLLNGGVNPRRITVWTHDHDPSHGAYVRLLADAGVRHQVTHARGITAQRREIVEGYAAGTRLVQADDDITALMRAVDPKTLDKITDVDRFYNDMFDQTQARGLHVWGLAPVPNAFYMNPGKLSERLKFLIFANWGCITRPGHPVHVNTVPTKDDYELSLRAWWYDGAVLRHDGVAAKADIYKAPGGCQSTRDAAQVEASVAELMRQWPQLVRINHRRKSDYVEILLATKGRHPGHPAHAHPPGVMV